MEELAVWQVMVAHPVALLALVFLLDGLGLPLMPEVAALLAFAQHPTLAWGALLLAIIVAMEVGAALVLYGIVDTLGAPRFVRRLMAGYTTAMLLRDERLLLLNRVVPVLPVAGAFIAVNQWRPLRSFLFIAAGSLAKYALVFALSGLAYAYFKGPWAMVASLSLGGIFLAASWSLSLHRWIVARRAGRSAPTA
ncbi:MAG TPA: hypothetical protein VM286_07890 [Candidatus Thermoplasmatota archaeon]|nr:hypothetical protein [Candidatus Thermoplasmatota archaeon]